MDSYILRIYRRDPTDATGITGTIEEAKEGAVRQRFANAEELVALLTAAPTTAGKTRTKRKTR